MTNLPSWTAYHGIRNTEIDPLNMEFKDLSKKPDGIHLGSLKQARMRAGKGSVLEVKVHGDRFNIPKIKRVKDRPDAWAATNKRARREGVSALVYLNRWESVDNEVLEGILALRTGRFDKLSDSEVRKHFPQLEDSWVVLDPEYISIERVLTRDQVDELLNDRVDEQLSGVDATVMRTP